MCLTDAARKQSFGTLGTTFLPPFFILFFSSFSLAVLFFHGLMTTFFSTISFSSSPSLVNHAFLSQRRPITEFQAGEREDALEKRNREKFFLQSTPSFFLSLSLTLILFLSPLFSFTLHTCSSKKRVLKREEKELTLEKRWKYSGALFFSLHPSLSLSSLSLDCFEQWKCTTSVPGSEMFVQELWLTHSVPWYSFLFAKATCLIQDLWQKDERTDRER